MSGNVARVEAWRDCWRTPPELLEALVAELGPIGLDAAASAEDAVCPWWLGVGRDGLSTPWASAAGPGWWWCNPPYSVRAGPLGAWLRRAWGQVQTRAYQLAVVCAPPGVGVAYRAWAFAHAVEIRDLVMRVAFVDPRTGQPGKGPRDGTSLFFFQARHVGPARVTVWDPRSGSVVQPPRRSWGSVVGRSIVPSPSHETPSYTSRDGM